MKINFFLGRILKGAAGGYKVVYQYSNYLASKGHDVHIYYTLMNGENGKHIPKFLACLIRRILFIGYPKWYKLDKNVSQSAVKNFSEKYIRDADISIATAAITANPVYKLSNSKGKKVYFIQGYENWSKTSADGCVEDTYKLGMNNIVVSRWLKEIVDNNSTTEATLIPNGIDLNVFTIDNSIEKRFPHSISMAYSNGVTKGCEYGLEIIKKLKEKYNDLEVNIFGNCNPPKNLPIWINYKKNAMETEVIEILNKSSVFMCTSIEEGFGLPGLEAMACGCALVTTNCCGNMEYANKDNSMISNPKDVQTMYENIDKLLSDNKFRVQLAKKGNEQAKTKGLKASQESFERYLIELLK